MSKNVAKKVSDKVLKAKKYLADYYAPKCFYLSNGTILKNMKELAAALTDLPEYVFQHHVNADRNDFYNWVKEVLDDQVLAKSIKNVKTKAELEKKIKDRLASLQKLLK